MACQNSNRNQQEVIYSSSKKKTLDAWFSNPENVGQPEYKTKFQERVSAYQAKGNFDSAFLMIRSGLHALNENYSYDSQIVEMAKGFLRTHKNQVPELQRSAAYSDLLAVMNIAEETDSMLAYGKQGFSAVTDYGTCVGNAGIHRLLSSAFERKNQHDSAIHHLLLAIPLFEQTVDSLYGLGACYDDLATIYSNMGNSAEQENYLDKSLLAAKQGNFKDGILVCYINRLAGILGEKEMPGYTKHADSLMYYNRKFNLQIPMIDFLTYSAYSISLSTQKRLVEAKNYLDSATAILQANRGSIEEHDFYKVAQQKYAEESNQVGSYLPLFTNELERALQDTDQTEIINLSDVLYLHYKKQGQYQQALRYKEMNDSVKVVFRKEEMLHQVQTLDKKFQTVKKEKTIVEQRATLQQYRSQITALLLSIVGLSLGVLFFLSYKKRKQVQKDIFLQQKFTDELLQNTEDERKRIATDLHDGVNHELLTLKNYAGSGKVIQSEEIDKVIQEVRQVSRDLYPAMFDQIGLAASIEALCERMTEAGLFTTCEINYTMKLTKRNELQLYRIIQEALNNTLKHAKAQAARVTIATVGNELQVEIKDNGIGFNAEEKMNSASSFGMQSLIQRARAMGGKSSIESNEDGTKLILKTPIY
jgi:two-component system NarL family sensor kinase